MQTVINGSIDMPVNGVVSLQGTAIQGFANGDAPWAFVIRIDGVDIVRTGTRIAMEDVVPLMAFRMITGAPRAVPIEVLWEGAASITLNACAVSVLGFPNTQITT